MGTGVGAESSYMGKEQGNNGDRGGDSGVFELAPIRGATSATEAASEAAKKAEGRDGDASHPSQLHDSH